MGTMVAGWDKTGPNLYYVDNDGLRIKNEKFSVSKCRVGFVSTPQYRVVPLTCAPRLEAEALTLSACSTPATTTTCLLPTPANSAAAPSTTLHSATRALNAERTVCRQTI